MNSDSSIIRSLLTTALTLSAIAFTGCGESAQEKMMRAAMRSRPKSDDANEEDRSPPQRAEVAKTTDSPPGQVSDQDDLSGAANSSNTEAGSEKVSIVPIHERKPETPLSETQRREMAFKNLSKISKVLREYSTEKKGFPAPYLMAGNGVPTLSWRVAMLPRLGYQDLYNKFDKEVPWDKEPNLSLLQYIPDEFVSPERFDTKTNFQVPANRRFLFGHKVGTRTNKIEDGIENTIMLLEVNDADATEWTRPVDFDPKDFTKVRDQLGGLRKDGTFASWANGWTVLLSRSLSSKQLTDAMTYEAGDGQMAGKIHREISVDKKSDAAVAAKSVAETDNEMENSSSAERPEEAPEPKEIAIVRDPVPSAIQLAEAQQKLRKVYASKIRDANQDDEKRKLANEFLTKSGVMDSDPAGAYALQTASLRTSIDGGAPQEMITAIDQRVGRFEVDAYQENVQWMLEFGEELKDRDPDTVEGKEYLKRAIHIAHAGVIDNDFVRASAIVRIAYRLTGQSRDEKIPKLLNRLRTQLSSAQREYDRAAESLSIYRQDSENTEAGAAFGRFLCFIKGDWGTGLPLIAMSTNKSVRDVAKLDLKGASDFQNQVAIADVWWALSRKANGNYRQGAQDRAVHWYKMAFHAMPESLDRIHVKNRLDEADDSDGRSPIALCRQLAEALGVDLSVSLASMGNNKYNRAGRNQFVQANEGDEYD